MDLSTREKKVLVELLKNAKISDRELANKLQTSQPTVTRLRNQFLENGLISAFTVVPSLSKIGLNLMVFTFFQNVRSESKKNLHDWVKHQHSIVFSAEGEGLREHTMVLVSVHPNFDDGERFLKEVREKFDQKIDGISSFFAPIQSTVKEFNLADVVESFILKNDKKSAK